MTMKRNKKGLLCEMVIGSIKEEIAKEISERIQLTPGATEIRVWQ